MNIKRYCGDQTDHEKILEHYRNEVARAKAEEEKRKTRRKSTTQSNNDNNDNKKMDTPKPIVRLKNYRLNEKPYIYSGTNHGEALLDARALCRMLHKCNRHYNEHTKSILNGYNANSEKIQKYIYSIYNAFYGETLQRDDSDKQKQKRVISGLNTFLEKPESQEFLRRLFSEHDKDGITLIDTLDKMWWCVKEVDSGSWAKEQHSPIGFLATKILGVYESDTTVNRRDKERKQDGKIDISINYIVEDDNGHRYDGADLYLPRHEDRTIADKDDRLLNIEYLDKDEKRMFDLRVKGFKIRELQEIFNISKSQVETRLKNIYEKIANPNIGKVSSAEKECKHCHEVKPLDEFTKDSRRNDGHGSICKKCDKERKKKNKNNFTGNIGKIAV